MGKRHNRRQRKKLHIGEFQELGFVVSTALREDITVADAERVCGAFIVDCIEANQFGYGGAIVDKLDGFVVRSSNRASATEAHRDVVRLNRPGNRGGWLV